MWDLELQYYLAIVSYKVKRNAFFKVKATWTDSNFTIAISLYFKLSFDDLILFNERLDKASNIFFYFFLSRKKNDRENGELNHRFLCEMQVSYPTTTIHIRNRKKKMILSYNSMDSVKVLLRVVYTY